MTDSETNRIALSKSQSVIVNTPIKGIVTAKPAMPADELSAMRAWMARPKYIDPAFVPFRPLPWEQPVKIPRWWFVRTFTVIAVSNLNLSHGGVWAQIQVHDGIRSDWTNWIPIQYLIDCEPIETPKP